MKEKIRQSNFAREMQSKKELESVLRRAAALSSEELLAELGSTETGLSKTIAAERLEEFGPNLITSEKHNGILHRLREAFVNPFNLILLVIATVSFFTDVVFAKSADYLTITIILGMIALSGIVAFIQGRKSDDAVEHLTDMISNTTAVLRDGEFCELPMDEVVPGDIVRLSAGDMLPADVRFLRTKDTFVAQSALTGESAPVEKFSHSVNDPSLGLTDLDSIGFMGTNIVSGSAQAVLLATGNDTYFGSMAGSLSGKRAKTSFERGVEAVSKMLLRMMIFIVPFVFLINGFSKNDWIGALLFAVTIAVGLTPEMLPVIMTSTLAKGAVNMSKHKVIVRTLGAIQSFGEMDILCTDKTGTLTEDKVVLEKYMNVHGDDDTRVLRHAYLNSYFQTGLKNLIDLAVINRAASYGMENLIENYICEDEIPFDFSRRRMSVILRDQHGKRQLITKGAVEEVIAISAFIESNGQILPLDEELRAKAMAVYERYNQEGLRMIAVAQKNEIPAQRSDGTEDECEMVLIGFVGFLDPPKESAKAAITALSEHGVRTVVLTGDSAGVAAKVCAKVGIKADQVLTGSDIDEMDDDELRVAADGCDIFAKLSPNQKARVVEIFQRAGHTVGYMGDGINDALPLRQSDVGISVDTATDIAKETADIILLQKDLMVLEEGVIQGRQTFGNVIKYIKMAASGNFGNIFSVVAASLFLPFLPMLPVQMLTQNLLCDFAQMGIPFDSVDAEYLKKPRKWETKSIKSFMTVMGPLSSIFDILCYIILLKVFKANTPAMQALFHCGWFVFGASSQVLIIHIIRTGKIPFIGSMPSRGLIISTATVLISVLLIGFTRLAEGIDMSTLPLTFLPWLALLLFGYATAAQVVKRFYIRKFGAWL